MKLFYWFFSVVKNSDWVRDIMLLLNLNIVFFVLEKVNL